MKYIIASILIMFLILIILSMCKASSDADKKIETILAKEKNKTKGV